MWRIDGRGFGGGHGQDEAWDLLEEDCTERSIVPVQKRSRRRGWRRKETARRYSLSQYCLEGLPETRANPPSSSRERTTDLSTRSGGLNI